MVLADLGADVVKVEPPADDPARAFAPFNGGDQLRALGLCASSDAVVENFRPGVMGRVGLGWTTLHAVNLRLVLSSISGFGQDNPYAQRPAYDITARALRGLMSTTGPAGGLPRTAYRWSTRDSSGHAPSQVARRALLLDEPAPLYVTQGALSA
jgi:crotonobetainyl-CoA:carnitine CoA-transferase CaiB-like acyl-CoA transferase